MGSSCGACDSPPSACYAPLGSCDAGVCVYTFVAGATCDDGNACTVGDICSNGGCAGTPLACTTPPPAVCASGTESITYDPVGACTGGVCAYTQHTTMCSGGPCTNGTCSTDPCSGIACNTPPSVCFASTGSCTAGSCTYAYANGAACNDDNPCTANDTCETGVCQGAPMACDTPPANVCANASTLEAYSAVGTCSLGTCSYSVSYVGCPAGCANGACAPSGWAAMNSNTTENLVSV